MDDPPKPRLSRPDTNPQGLEEVERALSLLHGRHPHHERLRREDAEKQAVRKASDDAVSNLETRRLRRRVALIGGTVLAIVGVASVIGIVVARDVARRGRLEHAEAPYEMFTLVDSSSSPIASTVTPGCFLVVSAGGGAVRMKYPGGELAGPSPLLMCLCESAAVEVSSADEGVVLLRAEASAIGGAKAFSTLPFATGTLGATDAVCSDAYFDAWLDATSWRSPPPPASLGASAPKGFRPLASAQGTLTVVDVPADACVVVRGSATLRLRGGAPPVRPGPGDAAWCSPTATTLTLRDADAIAFVGPALRIGGLGGLAELASVARTGTTDHAWNAKAFLVASAVPESLITTANAPDLGDDPGARVVATSSDIAGTLTAETADGVWSFCAASLCVFSGPQKWRLAGTSDGAVARARSPFWLYGLEGVGDPGAMKVAVQLLGLARRLRRDGFEPTTIEALTETDRGVEILGRANEDAVVAITVFKTAPWFVPYTDGPAWSLDGEPRIVPLATLQRVTLVAVATPPRGKLPPKAARHTIVFRRTAR